MKIQSRWGDREKLEGRQTEAIPSPDSCSTHSAKPGPIPLLPTKAQSSCWCSPTAVAADLRGPCAHSKG